MRFKSGCYWILCISFTIYDVESKLLELFSNKIEKNIDPCAAIQDNGDINSSNQYKNSDQEKPIPGDVQNGEYPKQGVLYPNQQYAIIHSTNAIVFPGPVEKSTDHNSPKGSGCRTNLDQSSSSRISDARETVEDDRRLKNSLRVIRSQHQKSVPSHSSQRRKAHPEYYEEYDEVNDSSEETNTNKTILESTASPVRGEAVVGVIDGRCVLCDETKCPAGSVADKNNACREHN